MRARLFSRGFSDRRSAALTIFVGAGGVGKTTLSAAYALSLAWKGEKVALLSIDPARRLRTVLGMESLGDEGNLVTVGSGSVLAAELQPEVTLRRWVNESCGEGPQVVLKHPLFQLLSTRIAAAADVLAAARIAELHAGGFSHVVVDTAPGLHALDFLTHPERLASFFDSQIFHWLLSLAGSGQGLWRRAVTLGAGRVFKGLGALGGEGFLRAVAEFLVAVGPLVETLSRRLELARTLFRSRACGFYVVCTGRPDSVEVAQTLLTVLEEQRLPLRAAVVNRSWPRELRRDPGFVTFMEEMNGLGASAFASYLESVQARDAAARARLEARVGRVVAVPLQADIWRENAMEKLAALGDELRTRE